MKKVLFVCIENSCRSQMAQAWLNSLADPAKANASSAGTVLAQEVNPNALKAMQEAGISMEGHHPKRLTPEMNDEFDYIVTMGCKVKCPITPREKTIEWNIEDPKGMPLEKFREVRDIIKKQVQGLIQEIGA